jgi:site-specific DNA-methyltransferase (adenine-specific)
MVPELFGNGIQLYSGDCLEVLPQLLQSGIDAVITDPPYGIGFMNLGWDRSGIAFKPDTWAAIHRVMKPGAHLAAFGGTRTFHRMMIAIEDAGFELRDTLMWVYGTGFPKSKNHLKPGYEPIALFRKPGPSKLNIDGCRATYQSRVDMRLETRGVHSTTKPYNGLGDRRGAFGGLPAGRMIVAPNGRGRWPANFIHDGSDEVLAGFPETGPSTGRPRNNGEFRSVAKGREYPHVTHGHDDTGGSAARFFYCAKATKRERIGSKHPTVKPVALLRWLCRLITPPNGTILDPFAGTGTTGEATILEGFSAVLIEHVPEYQNDIRRRVEQALTKRSSTARQDEPKAKPMGRLFACLNR